MLRRYFLSLTVMVAAALTTHVASATNVSDSGTLASVRTGGGMCAGGQPVTATGFESGAFGSYTPDTLTGGKTIFELFDRHAVGTGCPPNVGAIMISGFASDPGSAWLSSVTCGSVTNAGSSAGYSFSSGRASWSWTTLFGFPTSGNVSCTIVHADP